MTNREIVCALWAAIEARDWRVVEELCDASLVYSLPQSGEVYDRGGFLRVNREYPGDWHVSVEHVVDGGDWLVTEVTVSIDDRVDRGVSLFRVVGAKVVELREYWPEPFPVPEWRLAWGQER